MKKMVLFLVATVISVMAKAQNYNFPINEEGDCVITESIDGAGDAKANYLKVKEWVNSQSFKAANINQDENGKVLNYQITKNTKSSYNPFAGQFTEDLLFKLVVNFEGNKVNYTIQNLQIQEMYAGYGVNNKTTGVPQMITKLKEAQTAIETAKNSGDKKAYKKAKKEFEDVVENTTETLEKASSELENLRSSLRSAVK